MGKKTEGEIYFSEQIKVMYPECKNIQACRLSKNIQTRRKTISLRFAP